MNQANRKNEAQGPSRNRRPQRSQECRLGIVMYGGVSLAIYIFGVAQELFNAVRGRGVYRLLKAITDSDIVVDIVSGSSAGGVNGILLGYALANEREFSACGTLWRDAGDISALLRKPDAPPDKAWSVLNSEYYQKQLEQGLAGMPAICRDEPEDPSQLQELDLFITGTDVDGRVYTWFDDQGHAVDVKDHRAVFMLKHRAGRKTPFSPGKDPDATHQALAKLARITSCFPVALRPVHVENIVPRDDGPVDARLQHWGRLGKEAYLLDGGVLDNKPFTHAIREIFYRLSDRKVDRKLFYVEPDPERFIAAAPDEPPVLKAALKSLVSIPGYESIADDLKLLAARNEKLRRYNRLLKAPVSCKPTPATRIWIERLRNPGAAPAASPDEEPGFYVQARLMELSERVVRGVLRDQGRDVLIDKSHLAVAELLFNAFPYKSGIGEQTLRDFDIYFRLRRIFHVLYSIREPEPDDSADSIQRHTVQAARIGRQLKLPEVLSAAMERLVDEARVPWVDRGPEEVWQTVQAAFCRLLHADGLLPPDYGTSWVKGDPGECWLDQAALKQINTVLRERSDAICDELLDSAALAMPAVFDSALLATDACERQMMIRLGSTLKQEHDGFLVRDAQFLPLEIFAELRERDIIETVRISPLDAQRGFSKLSGADKISGDVFHHFGGFFKRSWRSNDILWGRLDGLCQLVETLFTPERIRQVAGNKSLRTELRARLAADLAPSALFPRSACMVQQHLAAWLAALFSETESARDAALNGQFDAGLSLLVEAAQLEVLARDMPEVIRDAVQQQAEWNQYRFSTGSKKQALDVAGAAYDAGADTFYVTGPGNLDPVVIAAASEKLAGQTGGLNPDVAGFFRRSYRVGQETIETGIPPLVLMEIGAHALLATRNAIVSSAGKISDTLRSHPANRWLGFFLWGVYGLARFMRTTPGGMKLFIFTIVLVSVQALMVGIIWWKEILRPAEDFAVRWFIVLVLLPVLVLAALLAWLWRRAGGLARLGMILVPLFALAWWRKPLLALLQRLCGC